MNYINKTLLFTFLLASTFLSAQSGPPAPPGGGGGGVGPGAPASPIDMYVYVLGLIAILFIAYYSKKVQKKLV